MEPTNDRLRNVTRSWLLARSTELNERVRRVEADLRRQAEPLPADSSEAVVVLENDEVLDGIRAAALDELKVVDLALKRVDLGTFTICEKCGGEIEPKRIEAAPYATCCASCAREG